MRKRRWWGIVGLGLALLVGAGHALSNDRPNYDFLRGARRVSFRVDSFAWLEPAVVTDIYVLDRSWTEVGLGARADFQKASGWRAGVQVFQRRLESFTFSDQKVHVSIQEVYWDQERSRCRSEHPAQIEITRPGGFKDRVLAMLRIRL